MPQTVFRTSGVSFVGLPAFRDAAAQADKAIVALRAIAS